MECDGTRLRDATARPLQVSTASLSRNQRRRQRRQRRVRFVKILQKREGDSSAEFVATYVVASTACYVSNFFFSTPELVPACSTYDTHIPCSKSGTVVLVVESSVHGLKSPHSSNERYSNSACTYPRRYVIMTCYGIINGSYTRGTALIPRKQHGHPGAHRHRIWVARKPALTCHAFYPTDPSLYFSYQEFFLPVSLTLAYPPRS